MNEDLAKSVFGENYVLSSNLLRIPPIELRGILGWTTPDGTLDAERDRQIQELTGKLESSDAEICSYQICYYAFLLRRR